MTEQPNPDDELSPLEMVELMKQYYELPEELDYYLALEFSVLSRLRGCIPNDICGYLLFHGPSGSGKSHAAQFVVEISNGDFLQAVSEGALLAGVSSGKLIGIDEIDGQARRIESTEDILRVGHTWDAKYRKMMLIGNNHEARDISCGGPKVLTSIGMPEQALASRCYAIEMSKSSKSAEFTTRWPYRNKDVLKIALALDKLAERIRQTANVDELEIWHCSQEHIAELSKLKSVHARRMDLANIFTTADHLLGWNVAGIVDAMGRETIDEERETICSYLRELQGVEKDAGTDIEEKGVKATRILEFVNQRRKEAGQRALSPRILGKMMTELGFTEKGNKVRRSDGIYYLFNDQTERTLGRRIEVQRPPLIDDTPAWSQEKIDRLGELVDSSGLYYNEFVETHPDLKMTLDYAIEHKLIGKNAIDGGLIWLKGAMP